MGLLVYQKYLQLILYIKPSKQWKFFRFLLHWITLFPKLLIIWSLGAYQILKNYFFTTPRLISNEIPSDKIKKYYFQQVFSRLPILKTDNLELYTTRVPYFETPNGTNHNTDHQCLRHSTYSFLMNKLGLSNDNIDKALLKHIQIPFLCRGYKYNPYDQMPVFNIGSVSGDMLCGLSLAILTTKSDSLKDSFEQLIIKIIDNDYALQEGESPYPDELHYNIYKELLNQVNGDQYRIPMKSIRGMWQPGIESVGALALTVLAALRVADKKLGSPVARKEYRKLLWKYGYGILSLFPTAYIDNLRGYSNDHNCMTSLYVLSTLADTKWGKLFWKIPMVYTWLLSRHWFNGYFTGLLNQAHPGVISKEYMDKCKMYLYEYMPRTWGLVDPGHLVVRDVPAPFNQIAEDEFSPDIAHSHIYKPEEAAVDNKFKIRTGLGFISCAIMLEDDPMELFKCDYF